jgi:hypothetical protein
MNSLHLHCVFRPVLHVYLSFITGHGADPAGFAARVVDDVSQAAAIPSHCVRAVGLRSGVYGHANLVTANAHVSSLSLSHVRTQEAL